MQAMMHTICLALHEEHPIRLEAIPLDPIAIHALKAQAHR